MFNSVYMQMAGIDSFSIEKYLQNPEAKHLEIREGLIVGVPGSTINRENRLLHSIALKQLELLVIQDKERQKNIVMYAVAYITGSPLKEIWEKVRLCNDQQNQKASPQKVQLSV
jgi:hypothetical protein